MITKEQFYAGQTDVAQKEAKAIVDAISECLSAGITSYNHVTRTKTSIHILSKLVSEELKKSGWDLSVKYVEADRSDTKSFSYHVFTLS